MYAEREYPWVVLLIVVVRIQQAASCSIHINHVMYEEPEEHKQTAKKKQQERRKGLNILISLPPRNAIRRRRPRRTSLFEH